jgi:hypothetical protein
MSLPRDGIEFVAQNADRFMSALEGATKATGALGAILEQAPQAAQAAGAGLDILSGILQGVGQQLITFAVDIAGRVIDGIVGIGAAMADLATEAAQLQGVAAGFGNFAAQTEAGAEAILASLQAASAGMISTGDLMTKFNDAAALVSVQFAERLPEGLEILGKVSAATGTDLNYLLDSFVTGIGRVSPMILDNLKIQVGVAEATAFAAEMFGKEEKQLTKVEQQMALTELTLTKLTEKFGGLPDVTQSATANLARIDAMFSNIRAQLGAAFLPAWTTMTNAVANAVGWFSSAIQEGGALFPILSNLGAVASVLADGFDQAVSAVIDFVSGVQTSINTGLSETVDNALSWGINIATSFAQGLIDGAATALTVAMNFISGMLSGWLAPGSPPMVAPDLPEWGAAAMTSFLGGFGQADYGILEAIQGPLSRALGDIEFAEISQEIARAMSAGEVDEGLFQTIAASAGEFGAEIAELARLEFGLVASTEALARAQDDLAASGKAVGDSQSRVADLTAEYNEMLRAGATEEQLSAQLDLINAAEKQRDAAIEQNAANRDALETAEASATVDRERIENQRDLVDQLLALSGAASRAAGAGVAPGPGAGAGARVGAVAAGAGLGIPSIAEIIPPMADLGAAFDFTGGLTTAIENAKGLILEKFGTIFDPIKTIIDEKFGPESAIGQKWGEIAEQIQTVWDEKLVPFWEDTLKPAVETVQEAFTNMQTFWEESSIPTLAGEAFGIFLDVVTSLAEHIIPFLADQLLKVSEWFVENGPMIDEVITALVEAWELVAPVFELAWITIEPILDETVTGVLGLGTAALEFATGDWQTAWDTAQTTFAGFATASEEGGIQLILGLTKMLTGPEWLAFTSMWQSNWDSALLIVSTFGADVLAAVALTVTNITTWISEQWETFKDWGRDMIRGLEEGITDKVESVIGTVADAVGRAVQAAKDALGIRSSSAVFAELAENSMSSYANTILESGDMIANAMESVLGAGAMEPIIAVVGGGAQYGQDAQPMLREVSIQIGPNYIQGIDDRQFVQRVRQVLRDELRRN